MGSLLVSQVRLSPLAHGSLKSNYGSWVVALSVMDFGRGYGWCWVCLLMGFGDVLAVGGVGFTPFIIIFFSSGGGFDECGCG